MPFWTWFWLIVPAVALLTASVVFYLRTAHHADEDLDS
jgi:hypothetical protein